MKYEQNNRRRLSLIISRSRVFHYSRASTTLFFFNSIFLFPLTARLTLSLSLLTACSPCSRRPRIFAKITHTEILFILFSRSPDHSLFRSHSRSYLSLALYSSILSHTHALPFQSLIFITLLSLSLSLPLSRSLHFLSLSLSITHSLPQQEETIRRVLLPRTMFFSCFLRDLLCCAMAAARGST